MLGAFRPAIVAAAILVLACWGFSMAQEYNTEQMVRGCIKLEEGMNEVICSCVAATLEKQISAEDFNKVAQAWDEGKAQTPDKARPLFGDGLVKIVDESFDQCGL